MGKGLNQVIGDSDAQGLRLAVVAARWNSVFTDRLVVGAVDAFKRHGASEEDMQVVRVPGSFEVPIIVRELALSGRCDAVVALGMLIRGQTIHYELIAREVSSGIMKIMLETGVPVSHGVLAVENLKQAEARSQATEGDNSSVAELSEKNRGFEAAIAAIEMARIVKGLRRDS